MPAAPAAQDLKTIVRATPNVRFQPEKVAYYRKEVQPKLYGFAVVTAITLVLLAFFIAWCEQPRPAGAATFGHDGVGLCLGSAEPLLAAFWSKCSSQSARCQNWR